MRPLPKMDVWDDYFRSTSYLVKFFYAKECTRLARRAHRNKETTKILDKTKKNNRLQTQTVPEWWSCRQISRLEQVSLSRCFVVLSFRRFAIETEESNKFQMFEFQTRLATIATIAMATRPTQPESAIEARHVSQILWGWVQGYRKSLLGKIIH